MLWPTSSLLLLVEDLEPARERIAAALRRAGHEVVEAVGADGDELLLPDGARAPIPENLGGAVLDHYFLGGHDGRTLTTRLLERGIGGPILAISSSTAANEAMVRLGAARGIAKATFLRELDT